MKSAEKNRFEVVRYLTEDEVGQLDERFQPILRRLHKRYATELSMEEQLLVVPAYLDFVWAAWQEDVRRGRPKAELAIGALGYCFGQLLAAKLKMRWAVIRDGYGECVSMVYVRRKIDPSRPSRVSIPPFSYVAKRESVSHANLFTDGLKTFRQFLRGGAKSVRS